MVQRLGGVLADDVRHPIAAVTNRYDIIGDIHGCARQLEDLLIAMGYEHDGVSDRHAERRAIFLGDFIDRGPQQAATLDIVRTMVGNQAALAVMGNHEFNAICYATPSDGGFLRPRTEKNTHQHAAFLAEFPLGSETHRSAIAWFSSLPLWLDLAGIGVVHACWDEESFAAIAPHLRQDRSLPPEAFRLYAAPATGFHDAIERILKGPEHALPEQLWFKDKDGHPRSHARIRWWQEDGRPNSEALEFGGATLSTDQLELLDAEPRVVRTSLPTKPIFVGHYWLRGEPEILSERVACVDYSVAKGGKLVAYRWDGETVLSKDKFFWTERESSQLIEGLVVLDAGDYRSPSKWPPEINDATRGLRIVLELSFDPSVCLLFWEEADQTLMRVAISAYAVTEDDATSTPMAVSELSYNDLSKHLLRAARLTKKVIALDGMSADITWYDDDVRNLHFSQVVAGSALSSALTLAVDKALKELQPGPCADALTTVRDYMSDDS